MGAIRSNVLSLYFHLLHTSPNPRHLRHLHARLLRTGLYSNVILSTKLLLSYSSAPHRLLPSGVSVFLHMPHRNSHSFNSLIAALSRSSHHRRSLYLFLQMRRRSSAAIDEFTLPPVLRSCAALGSATTAMAVHGVSLKLALARNLFVASALVYCYMGLSRTDCARLLFDEMPHRDAVLWTSMLSGYAQSGEPESAVDIFREMAGEGIYVDRAVAVSLLTVCGQLGWLRHGKSVHGCSVRRWLGLSLNLGNALTDMYVKCGALGSAERAFGQMECRDVISWSALILGHGLNGRADSAIRLFDEMRAEGVQPNSVTFLGVLSACGHSGMVERAWGFFDMMRPCGVEPELKHYACLVDALGRAGQLVEAERFVEEMPVEPDEAVLGCLLSGCRVHGNVEVGERVSKRLMVMRPDKGGYYVNLANMFSDAGRFGDAGRMRARMRQLNVDKLPGCSLIELDGFASPSGPT